MRNFPREYIRKGFSRSERRNHREFSNNETNERPESKVFIKYLFET